MKSSIFCMSQLKAIKFGVLIAPVGMPISVFDSWKSFIVLAISGIAR